MDKTYEKFIQDNPELIEKYPIIYSIFKRESRIRKYEEKAEAEQDIKEKNTYLQIAADLLRTQNTDIQQLFMQHIFEASKYSEGLAKMVEEHNDMNQKLADKLQEERKAHNSFYSDFCTLMLVSPRETVEMGLRQMERREKINGDGFSNWQWGLHFPLIARLKMAYLLIFGNRKLDEAGLLR